jgi:hypothetical protein
MSPYSYIKGGRQTGSMKLVEVVESRLRDVMRPVLANVEFDEGFYRKSNPDVNEKIVQGELESGQDHYVHAGYFEDRLPRPVKVDESWYAREYPDVADAIRKGIFLSAAHHFGKEGFKEGRLPYAGWSLAKSRAD